MKKTMLRTQDHEAEDDPELQNAVSKPTAASSFFDR